MKRLALILSLFFAWSAQAQAPAPSAKQAELFAKSFYKWYLEKGKNRNVDSVLLDRKQALSPALRKMLEEDNEAQAKVPDEIVGLDFDPFLNAQDIAQKYEIGPVTAQGSAYWVDVYGIWNGKKAAKPDVRAEVECTASACDFANFHYDSKIPENRSLIQILQFLKKERAKRP